MALYLVTGQPGHGKTAYAIDLAFKFQKEGRSIYASGIKDFDYEKAGWQQLVDPTQWEQLPDGSVVLLDECYNVFPNRNAGSKVPPHVDAMARHRHRGFDFILVAQQGLQLDPFLRGLYESHVHVRQNSVWKRKTKLKRWDSYQGAVNGPCADVVDWIRPKYVFDYYTSTTLVTTKRSMPMWMRWVIVGVAFVVVMMLWLKHRMQVRIQEAEAVATAAASPGAVGSGAPGAGPPVRTFATPLDYAKAHLPRFATMPETAPIFDDRPPVSQPALYCMSSMGGIDAQGNKQDPSCTCLTEQGTRYEITQPECRTVARHGQPYNPYKMPAVQPAAMSAMPAVDAVAAPGPSSAVVGYKPGQRADVFPQNPAKTIGGYTPPTSTL